MARMKFTGVGLKIYFVAAFCFLVALAIDHTNHEVFVMCTGFSICAVVGYAMLLAPLLGLWTVWRVRKAYKERRLVTSGIYSVCRHPIYALALVAMFGVVLLLQSWVMLVVPLVAYLAARILIRDEERLLVERFGQEYLDYQKEVNPFFPTLRRLHYAYRAVPGEAGGSGLGPAQGHQRQTDAGGVSVSDKLKILFLCTGNSCRSQMAEGWAKALKGDVIEAYSAGIETHGLNPNAVKVMAESGVDISRHQSKNVASVMDVPFDYVVTVCSHAGEKCPMFPGKAKVIHVAFDDPPTLAKEARTEEEALDCYRRVRDEIRAFIQTLPGAFEGDGKRRGDT